MEFLRSVRRLLVAACVVPSSPIFVTLMGEALGSSETSVLTRATRRNNPEDTILHSPVEIWTGRTTRSQSTELKSALADFLLGLFFHPDDGGIMVT
jgi:hypothetical protein